MQVRLRGRGGANALYCTGKQAVRPLQDAPRRPPDVNFWEKARVIHRAWRYRLRTESGCMKFMLQTLRTGQTALDIGAHKGVYAYWMCKRVGSSGRVVAFEPQHDLAGYIERLKHAFGFQQLSVVASALSSVPGNRDLHIPTDGLPGEATLESSARRATKVAVDAVTLDECLQRQGARPVHFIKCDVEGHELEVFRGGLRMLREDRPILMFECQDFRHPQGQIARVFSFVKELGYEGFFFDRGRMVSVEEFDVSIHQVLGKRYSDNFAFLPRKHSG